MKLSESLSPPKPFKLMLPTHSPSRWRSPNPLRLVCVGLLTTLLALCLHPVHGQGIINFPDPALEQAILDQLGRATGPVTIEDMDSLTTLIAPNYGITNLGGVDAASNLIHLDLGNVGSFRANAITNLDPLRNVAHKLLTLNLQGNKISDFSPLIPFFPSWTSKLTSLNLAGNQINDLTPLSVHPKLVTLDLSDNGISNLSPLSGLLDLTNLQLNENRIADLAPLASLTKLIALGLNQNRVSDASELAPLINLVDLRAVGNAIAEASFLQLLTQLQVLQLDDNELLDLTFPATLPGLTFLGVTENRLDLRAGSAQRAILDGLLARPGLTVNFDPQKRLPPVTQVSLWGMGNNYYGEIGQDSAALRNTPAWIDINIQSIAAGSYHSLFISEGDVLWAMGFNEDGQLGDGSNENRPTPVEISTEVRSASAGQRHSLFIKNDQTLWAMGQNSVGQLGDGTRTPRNVPVQIATGVQDTSAGHSHSLFLKTDGTLWAMGSNSSGKLGVTGASDRLTPVQIASQVRAMAAGAEHSLFVKEDGTLWAVGYNFNGQLGVEVPSHTLAQVASGVESVMAGTHHSLFLKEDNSLWAMGLNGYGQLGDGTLLTRRSPVQIATNIQDYAVGSNHSLYVKNDGTLWAMGQNTNGQLGDGNGDGTSPIKQAIPVNIDGAAWAVSAGGSHSLFLAENYRLTTITANGAIVRNPDRLLQPVGGSVTLTAVPDYGYVFRRWSGDLPLDQQFTKPLTLTMDQDRTVTAVFERSTYSLTTGAQNGTVTRNPNAGIYTHGDKVILTATPNPGYLFTHWTGDVPTGAETTNPLTVTIDANKTFIAHFIATYTLTTIANQGTITRDPNAPSYVQGTSVTLTATPNPGYHFVNWTDDVPIGSETRNPLALVMDANKTITANVAINTYTLITNATNGGIIRVPNLAFYEHGTPVTLTAVSAKGYRFVKWIGDIPVAVETANPAIITMDANKTITALFALKIYPLTIISNNGVVTQAPAAATYQHGTEVSLTATANPDYHFGRWTGDLVGGPTTANPIKILMDQARTITAQFVENLSNPEQTTLSRDWFLGNAPSGTTIGLLTALDPDEGDLVTFALVPGPGGTDNGRFQIIGNELQTKGAFSATEQSSFHILVEARDLANHTTTTALSILSVPTNPYAILTERSTFTTSPSYVSVLFKMQDQNGVGINFPKEFIKSQPDLFEVREDGGKLSPSESFLQIAKFGEVPSQLRTVILIDNSFSVRNELAQIKEAAKIVVDEIFEGQQIAIYSFSEQATLEQDFTDDPALLINAIDGIGLGLPTTNLYGSIIDTLNRWNEVFVVDGFSGLTPDDLLQLSALAAALRTPTDPVSQFIRGQLSAATLPLVDSFVIGTTDPDPLRNALVVDLNALLEGPNIYDPQRFNGITLRPKTQVLLAVDPLGDDLIELNRFLLEDAYPSAVARKKANAIETGYLVVLTDGSDQSGLATLNQVLTKRDQEGKSIFAIGLGDEIDPGTLSQIGNAGYRNVLQINALRDAFAEIQENIRNDANSFYWLNYASPKRGNFLRTLTVSLKENRNTGSGSILTTQFNSDGFSSISPGLILNRSVFRPNGVGYLNLNALTPQPLRAFTLLAFDPPKYEWAVQDADLIDLIPDALDPAQIHLVPKLNGLTQLTVRDTVNDYELTIPVRIDVEELIGVVVMIRQSPSDLRVVEGLSATLTGVVNEDVPGIVSWEYRSFDGDWTLLPGATSPTLTLNPVSRADSGHYRLIYTLGETIAYSTPATLSVAYRIVNRNAFGQIELAFIVEEGTEFALEKSQDLIHWEPANLTFTRDGDTLRAVTPPEGPRLYFRQTQAP